MYIFLIYYLSVIRLFITFNIKYEHSITLIVINNEMVFITRLIVVLWIQYGHFVYLYITHIEKLYIYHENSKKSGSVLFDAHLNDMWYKES